tara:strand:- start:246 stop:794 length:549 start_codon:yes stop_codon:yes gene_type:complete
MTEKQEELLEGLRASFEAMTPKVVKGSGLIDIAAIQNKLDTAARFVADIKVANVTFDELRRERIKAAYELIKGDIEALGLAIVYNHDSFRFTIGTKVFTNDKGQVSVTDDDRLMFEVAYATTQHTLDGGHYVIEKFRPRFVLKDMSYFSVECNTFEPLLGHSSFKDRLLKLVGKVQRLKEVA